jgi:hypothetical protein
MTGQTKHFLYALTREIQDRKNFTQADVRWRKELSPGTDAEATKEAIAIVQACDDLEIVQFLLFHNEAGEGTIIPTRRQKASGQE